MRDYSNYYPTVLETTLDGGKEIFEMQLIGIEGKDVTFNTDSSTRRVLIQRHTNPLNLTKKDYKVSVRYSETLNMGDNIKYKNKDYLVVSVPEDNEMYRWADMEHCTGLLNFINQQGKIVSLPCVYELSSLTNKDTTENKYMEVKSGDAWVKVQSNIDTLQLKDIKDIRFIFSETECYSLKNIFTTLDKGISYLKLEQTEINFEVDKYVDLGDGTFGWVADYENKDTFTLSIDQDNSEVITGNDIQLTAQIIKNGKVVSEDITWISSDENIATVNENGLVTTISSGIVDITATMTNNSNVSDSIQITSSASVVDNFSYTLSPDNEGITLTDTIVVSVQGYNNGVQISDNYTFSIDPGTTADSSDFEFTVIDSTKFSIKNIKDGKVVSVKIVPDSNVGAEFVKNYSLDYFY